MLGETFDEFSKEIENEDLRDLLNILVKAIPNVEYAFPDKLDTTAIRENKFGEATKELDSWTNTFFIETFRDTALVKILYSEESDEPVLLNEDGRFYVTIDPLDGSSNIVSNNPFGTIVSVFDKELPTTGRNAVCSLYVLYGPITTMAITWGNGVHEFVKTFKPKTEFRLVKNNLKLPEPGSVFGIGGTLTSYLPRFYAFVKSLAKEKKLKLRYCGALVGDFSQVLHYGGIFAYPALLGKPEGKLRLFFEAIPMSHLIEQAGGKGSNGEQNILDVEPKSVFQRTPVYLGNKGLIEELEKKLKE